MRFRGAVCALPVLVACVALEARGASYRDGTLYVTFAPDGSSGGASGAAPADAL